MKKLDVIVNVAVTVILMGVLLWADVNSRPYGVHVFENLDPTSDIRITEMESGPPVMLIPPQGRAGVSMGDVEDEEPPGFQTWQNQPPQAWYTASPEFRQSFTAYYIDLIDEGYKEAYNNCVIFIYFESQWEDVYEIDVSAVEIAPFREVFPNQAHCSTIDGQRITLRYDVEYLYFLIGDAQAPGRHYVGLVVDASTDQVVGYIPAE